MNDVEPLTLETADLLLRARLTPWDTDIFGFPVAQVDAFVLRATPRPTSLAPLLDWFDRHAIRFASCRLPSTSIGESMLLEACGFRYIETALHPHAQLSRFAGQEPDTLVIGVAGDEDMGEMEAIAASAFNQGRIHADPRLGPVLGSRRYARWVRNHGSYAGQILLKVLNEQGKIVALFITQDSPDRSIYWHLTAIAPGHQGKGYGTRVWKAMLAKHAKDGMRTIDTTITATNINVLNLYSKLGFQFRPPDMTFHWFRDIR